MVKEQEEEKIHSSKSRSRSKTRDCNKKARVRPPFRRGEKFKTGKSVNSNNSDALRSPEPIQKESQLYSNTKSRDPNEIAHETILKRTNQFLEKKSTKIQQLKQKIHRE